MKSKVRMLIGSYIHDHSSAMIWVSRYRSNMELDFSTSILHSNVQASAFRSMLLRSDLRDGSLSLLDDPQQRSNA
jgi:hypothetical protein